MSVSITSGGGDFSPRSYAPTLHFERPIISASVVRLTPRCVRMIFSLCIRGPVSICALSTIGHGLSRGGNQVILSVHTQSVHMGGMSRDLLPDYLRRWRRRRNVTQDALAAHLGIDRSVVVKWERGIKRIPLERLFDVAEFYGITAGQLLSDPDEVGAVDAPLDGTDVTREELQAVVSAYLSARKKGAQ